MNITTSITNTSLKNSANGLVIDFIDLVVNFVEPNNYFGGQIRLTAEDDGISFQTKTEDLQDLAIVKAKKLIADAQVVVPDPEYIPDEDPAQSEAPASEATSEATTTTTTADSTE
ncbi:hypothetical protein PWO95_06190 [Weissella paramesenteroides]|uniref:hypothetical protein n=1 Tax=Weissella paramesenteroides TaxID=1249 RepID=UPI0023A916B7|nr:hypothetical protein [Weissella paramesenteroides]WEA52231.1 hypothetical protein PWO95_06190 [Weissella paramesenteroides]